MKSPLILREYISQTGKIPEGLELIRDTIDFKPLDVRRTVARSPLAEDKNNHRQLQVLRCSGVFQRADTKNANGRIYPYEILKEAVGKLQKPISERQVMGEFDHSPDAKIHMDRVSHLITRLWWEGKTVMGEIEVINDTRCPCGNMLACFLDRNIRVGISSRGVGDMELVEHDGEDAYQVSPGFEFITFDSVAEPSVFGTQLNRMAESKSRQIALEEHKNLIRTKEKMLVEEIRKSFLS